MSTGTEGLDSKLGPLIPMGKVAVDAVPLTLLDHRGESLKARFTLSYGLVHVYGVPQQRLCVDFFTIPE